MKIRLLAPALCLLFIAAPAGATGRDCALVRTPDQAADAATIRRIEQAWLTAEMHGDSAYLDCLLTPGYAVYRPRTDATVSRDALLERVARNAGKTTVVPPLVTSVIVNGNYATAYSLLKTTAADGQASESSYVDSYVFEDGVWRAVGGVDL